MIEKIEIFLLIWFKNIVECLYFHIHFTLTNKTET